MRLMKEYYITFGFQHKHKIGELVLGRNDLVIIKADDDDSANAIAEKHFGNHYSRTVLKEELSPEDIRECFPGGIFNLTDILTFNNNKNFNYVGR